MAEPDPFRTHYHLDALGGMAGDMFVASVLDAFPEHEAGVLDSVAAVTRDAPIRCRLLPHHDGVLQGRRFAVDPPDPAGPHTTHHDHAHHDHAHHHHAPHGHDHAPHPQGHASHRSWRSIRSMLDGAALAPAVRDGATAIFGRLAVAEAQVHGIAPDQVTFHEVGAWDSIADIVAAAHLVAALGPARWTVGPLPLGRGRVRTAHGWLPVPVPATVLLLRGFETLDDGLDGERVTPTGAAILAHLCSDAADGRTHGPRRLGRTGIGFGTRVLPGLANCVRLLAYEGATAERGTHRELGVIEFEIDDQSAEELAMGLDGLRAHPDIFDVVQMPVFGKKGRIMTHVRVLARADAMDGVVAACFRETTTIGLRHHRVSGAALPRRSDTVEVGGRPMRVKTVERPGGRTAKAEADDAKDADGHAARSALRREAERTVLAARQAS